jgi:hypothetical protein
VRNGIPGVKVRRVASGLGKRLLSLGLVVAVTSLGGCGRTTLDELGEVALTSDVGGSDEGGKGGSTSLVGTGAQDERTAIRCRRRRPAAPGPREGTRLTPHRRQIPHAGPTRHDGWGRARTQGAPCTQRTLSAPGRLKKNDTRGAVAREQEHIPLRRCNRVRASWRTDASPIVQVLQMHH